MPHCTAPKAGTQLCCGVGTVLGVTLGRERVLALCCPPMHLRGPDPRWRGPGHLPTSVSLCPLPSWPGLPGKAQLPAGLAWWGTVLLREGAGLQLSGLQSRWGFVSWSVLVPLPVSVLSGALHRDLGAVNLAVRVLPWWGTGGWVGLGRDRPPPQSRGGAAPCHQQPGEGES